MVEADPQVLPPLPDDIPEWEIFTRIRGCDINFFDDEKLQVAFEANGLTLLHQLEGMG